MKYGRELLRLASQRPRHRGLDGQVAEAEGEAFRRTSVVREAVAARRRRIASLVWRYASIWRSLIQSTPREPRGERWRVEVCVLAMIQSSPNR